MKGALCDDLETLKIGFFHVTGTSDSLGRPILFGDPSKLDKTKYTRDSMARCLWYVLHALVETEEAQKYGVIVIIYPRHAHISQLDRQLMKINAESIKSCIPLRLAAVHACHPPVLMHIILDILRLFLGKRLRQRMRVHSGSDETVLQHLEGYGLTKDLIPTPLGGNVVVDPSGWVDTRLAAEL